MLKAVKVCSGVDMPLLVTNIHSIMRDRGVVADARRKDFLKHNKLRVLHGSFFDSDDPSICVNGWCTIYVRAFDDT